MKKLAMLFVAFLPLTLFANPVPIVSADDNKQSDTCFSTLLPANTDIAE